MTSVSAGRRTPGRSLLESFLLGEAGSLPPAERLRAAGLAGHSYVTLGSGRARHDFRSDFHGITLRHMMVRQKLALLLRAWQAEGVEALVFKGFYLAEFVYPSFGQRPYTDVDLLVRPEQVDAACRAAQRMGWELLWRAGEPDDMLAARSPIYHGHEAAQLRHRESKVLIDLHRRVVHNNHNRLSSHRRQTDLTEAVWNGSVETVWEDVRLRLPQPVDAVLFGLALNRCWGSDEWQVKPRDYPDFQALVARFEVKRDEVLERAHELRVRRTLDIYLDRCDPYRRLLRLGRPSWLDLRLWNLKVTPERGPRDLEQCAVAAYSLPGELKEILTALPTVLHLLSLRSKGLGVEKISQRLARSTRSVRRNGVTSQERRDRLGYREWRGIGRGIHRCLRLLRCQGIERELVGRLAACAELRRRGVTATVANEEGSDPPFSLLIEGRRVHDIPYLSGGTASSIGPKSPDPLLG